MQFALVTTKGKDVELQKIYDTFEQAERKRVKSFEKNGKIIKIPEVRAGLKIYKCGVYYRTILKETKCMWELNNVNNMMHYSDYMLKEHINKYFYLGIYDEGIEQYDPEFENNVYIEEVEDEVANDETENNENDNIESED